MADVGKWAKKKMSGAAMAGLKEYGGKTPTSDIKSDLEGKEGVTDAGALAAWIRRRGLGMSKVEFAKHGAKMKREGK